MTRKHPLSRCEDCTLYDAPSGPSEIPDDWTGKYLLVGQQPGREELKEGRPFVGMSGKLLRAALGEAGFEERDVAFTNAILCGAPQQREPSPHELACCKPRLMQGVEHAGRVLVMGKHAAITILGRELSIFKERGRYVEAECGTPVLLTIHPAYVLRRLGARDERADPSRDLFDDIEKLRREPYDGPTTEYRVATASDVEGWIRRIGAEGRGTVVSVDLECDNRPWPGKSRYLVSPYRDRILCGSMSWRDGFALVIPGDLLYAFSEEWCGLFRVPGITWTGHNIKFDFKMLQIQLGDSPHYPNTYDTMLAHYVLDERKGTHGLKPKLVGAYFDVEDWEPDLIQKHLRARTETFGDVPLEDLYKYSALDGDYERRLYFPLNEAVERAKLGGVLDFLLEVTESLIYLELQGAPVDLERLDTVEAARTDLMERMERLLQDTVHMHGWDGDKDINVRSVKQVAHYLYDIMGYVPPTGRTIRTKSGRSTNAEALERLAARHPNNPFFGTLREYRRHKKFVGTYCTNLRVFAEECRDPAQPAFHPQYMLIGTETGRLAGSLGLTWPAAADLDMPIQERLRTCFRAPPGKVWAKIDYSQAELRLLGWYSGDAYLKQVYQEGRDLHNEVSLKLFDKSRYDLEAKFSRAVKAVNFRFAYLPRTSPALFVEGMLIEPARAKALVKEYESLFAEAIEWKKAQIRKMREEQEVVSAAGRRRRFPLISNDNRDEYEKSAINAPIQSMSSDLILASLTLLRRAFEEHPEWEANIVLLMHDEVNVLLRPEHLSEFVAVARQIMELDVPARFGIYPEDMPLRVDFGVGPSWGEVEDYDNRENA